MEAIVLWWSENGYMYVGSVSGSLAATFSVKDMPILERLRTFIVQVMVGLIGGPAICEVWFSAYDPKTSALPSAVCAVTAALAMAILPAAISTVGKLTPKVIRYLVNLRVSTGGTDGRS